MHYRNKLTAKRYYKQASLEDAGLSLCNSITRGSGMPLKQGHVSNNAICNLFKYRAPQKWNSLPLNIVQCTNFTSFKRKLFVHFLSFKRIVLFI